jgi:peroxiredoxin
VGVFYCCANTLGSLLSYYLFASAGIDVAEATIDTSHILEPTLMKSVIMKHEKPRAAKNIAHLFLLLWLFPFWAMTGELSEIQDGRQPGFILPDLSGQQRSLDEFSGKVVLVNFWASWCRPCIDELPSIHRLTEAMHEKPFAVIGVNVAESAMRVRTAARRLGMKFPVLLDTDSRVFSGWGATVLPTAYVLDRNGRVRYVGKGPMEWDRVDIIEKLDELLEQPARH